MRMNPNCLSNCVPTPTVAALKLSPALPSTHALVEEVDFSAVVAQMDTSRALSIAIAYHKVNSVMFKYSSCTLLGIHCPIRLSSSLSQMLKTLFYS